MIRIMHLSDFHLAANDLDDLKNLIIPPLLRDISKFDLEKNFDFIVLSGDLIDKGGSGFNNDPLLAFMYFEEYVISPILRTLKLDRNRVFISPGNHDVQRELDHEVEEEGLFRKLDNVENVNKFYNDMIDSQNLIGIKRITPFKSFEREFYSLLNSNLAITNFQSNFKLIVGDQSIGVTCFNTAWRCYDSNIDKGRLILGERQILNSRKIINDCSLKIAVMHHPVDWLTEFDQKVVSNLLLKDYNMIFFGHVHEGSVWNTTNMYGNVFVSVAPSNWSYNLRSTSREYSNGYAIVDYDYESMKITVYNRRYSYNKECYDPNTDKGNDSGIIILDIPTTEDKKKDEDEHKLALYIRDSHSEEMNEHLITYFADTKAPKSIQDIFVMPQIVDYHEYGLNTNDEEKVYTIDDLLSESVNTIIFGIKESGKTILLDTIIMELTNKTKNLHKIPVFLDFEINGSKRIESIISRYLGIGIKEIDKVIKNHRIVLLVDNLNFSKANHHNIKKIDQSIKDYNLQVIATCNQFSEGSFPLEILEYPTFSSSKKLKINSFRAKEIRSLTKIWFSAQKNLDERDKLRYIMNVFESFNLPRTPMAISMLLWIIEQQESFKPYNHVMMLENFIEKLFKKHSKSEIYAEFDYRNKERLLSEIAYYMYKQDYNNYRLSYSSLLHFITDYLKIKKFNYMNSNNILDHFIDKGVLIKEYECNATETYLRFRFSCFFHYFLMKKMDSDPTFLEYVIHEDNYLSFTNEIDYYTGFKRDKTDILNMLVDRMNMEYKDLLENIYNIEQNFDAMFITENSITNKIDVNYVEKIKQQEKPTEQELDHYADQVLDNVVPDKHIEKKDKEINILKKLELLWIITATVLKNTEETADEKSKDLSYKSLLKCSLAFASLFKFLSLSYLEKNKSSLDKTANNELHMICKFLPLIHQVALYSLLGTPKLKVVISEKILEDQKSKKEISDIERFVSVFLYSDIGGPNSINYIKEFIRTSKHLFITDMVFLKLLHYYFMKSKTKEMDHLYTTMIADIIIKAKGINKDYKSKIIQKYLADKNKIRKEDDEDA